MVNRTVIRTINRSYKNIIVTVYNAKTNIECSDKDFRKINDTVYEKVYLRKTGLFSTKYCCK